MYSPPKNPFIRNIISETTAFLSPALCRQVIHGLKASLPEHDPRSTSLFSKPASSLPFRQGIGLVRGRFSSNRKAYLLRDIASKTPKLSSSPCPLLSVRQTSEHPGRPAPYSPYSVRRARTSRGRFLHNLSGRSSKPSHQEHRKLFRLSGVQPPA